MAKLHQFTRSLEPITDFDGEDEEDGISTGDGLHQIVAVRANEGTQNSMRNHSILAFLDQLCQHQEPDPEKQNRLYNYMCEALVRLNIIPAVSQLQFLAPVRKQFHDALMKLFSAAHRLVKEGNPMDGMVSAEQPQAIARFFTPSMKVDSLFNSATSDFLTSKFQTEFILISILGEGGYGSVFKAKKKADDIIYAVKKIKLNHDKKNAVKILPSNRNLWFANEVKKWLAIRKLHMIRQEYSPAFREVKQLAKLSHPNVIRYFDSWCEYEMESSILLVDETDNRSQHSNARSGASFITFERNEDSFSEECSGDQRISTRRHFTNNLMLSNDSGSIVFQHSRSTSQQVHRVNLSSSSRRSSSINQPAAHLGNGVNSALSFSHVSTAQFCNRNTELENVVLYIQTELCDMTLQDWLKSRNSSKDMDVTLNRQILKQILKGVEYIHSCGLVHRDIKPLNILLNRRDHGKCKFTVKICDFGLVRDISTGSETTIDVYRRLFQGPTRPFIDLDSGRLSAGIGTELYASPEQLAGSGYTNKTDMYSVGLLMYEIFCPMSTDMERMKRLNKIPKGILDEDFQRDWPTEAKFVRDLTQKDPGARPSATAVLNEYIKSNNSDFLKIELSNTQSELKKVKTLLSERDEQLRGKEEELKEKEEELKEKEEELRELMRQLKELKTILNKK